MAIRVSLFDGQPGVKYVEFLYVPIESQADYATSPADLAFNFEAACFVAHELGKGKVDGWVEQYRWYRQAGGSATRRCVS